MGSEPIRRRRDGRYEVNLDPGVRTVVASVAGLMGPLIDAGDPSTARLFPPAYTGDAEANLEKGYRELVDGALHTYLHQSVDVLVETAHADTLSADELDAWLSAVGSMRLVLGTRLAVTEDMDPPGPGDPAEAEYQVYALLSELQAVIIDVLAEQLPDEGQQPEDGF